jgi:hypothetical protein
VLQFLELLGEGLGAAVAVVVVVGVELVEVFLGHVVVGLVRVGEAVDDAGDDDLAVTDLGGQAQDLGDGGRRGRDGFHHGLQAAFDALGDLDLAFARQQFDRAHLAHVHAHRVGGAAEFAVHGGQGGLGFFLGFFHRRRGRRGVVQQEHLGVGRLLVHRHAQVVQHGDHDFQRLGVDQLLGQVVGDFAVGQVAARLAQRDQRLQALPALGHLLFGQDGLVEAELLHQGPFLGLADLHAQRLDLLGRRGRLGRRLLGELGFDVRQVDRPLPACRRRPSACGRAWRQWRARLHQQRRRRPSVGGRPSWPLARLLFWDRREKSISWARFSLSLRLPLSMRRHPS